MNLPTLDRMVDERFLKHRLRSTSLAGIGGALLAIGLFEYRLFVNHVWNWDVFAVPVTMLLIKLGAMAWFRWHD